MVKQNLRLLTAIRERGMRQAGFAKAVGDHESFVSRVINGWMNLDDKRKAKYSKVLGKSEKDLFE
jgi:hypothetical protein